MLRQCGLLTFEEMDVLGRERAAFVVDEDAVQRFRVALGESQLL